MQNYFSRLRIFSKIFFLALSLFLLSRLFIDQQKNSEIWNESAKAFIVDMSWNIAEQVDTIDTYLDGTTWQAVSLSTNAWGNTSLVLPATYDYQIYKAYLSSVLSWNSITTGNVYENMSLSHKGLLQSESSHQWITLLLIICILLALFL